MVTKEKIEHYMVNYSNSVIYKLCCTDPTITEILTAYCSLTIRFSCVEERRHEALPSGSSDSCVHVLRLASLARGNGGPRGPPSRR